MKGNNYGIDNTQFLLFWSINEKFDIGEIKRQIEWMHKNGITGFFIHSRAGREIDYLSKEWEQLCTAAIECAKQYGMKAWLYDEDGWPSGFAGGKVPKYKKEFSMKKLGYGKTPPCKSCILSAYRIAENGCRIRCKESFADEFLYITYDDLYADLLNFKAVKYFIETTHEWYKQRFNKYFGNVIPGIFTDEPQFNMSNYCWSDSIADKYIENYGVSILDDIWKLFVSGYDHNNEIRYRYYRTASDLFTESFTKQIAEWCDSNNLYLTGHFPNEDGLIMQVGSVGDVCCNYEYMQLPGIDHLGNRITSPVLLKQVSSVSGQLGKENILSETFGCSGWDVKFKDLLWIWGYQASQGVTVPCLHLSAYSIKGIRKRDYPPFFSYQNNWANEIGLLSDAIKTISSFIPRTQVKNDVLVLSPIDSVMRDANGAATEISSSFRATLENLLNNQIPYDIGAPAIMKKHAAICEKGIRVGNNIYNTVIVTPMSVFDNKIEKILEDFAKSGGKLICLGNTSYQNISYNFSEKVKCVTISNCLNAINKFFLSEKYLRPFTVLNGNGKIAKDLVVTYTTPFEKALVCNNSSSAQNVYIEINKKCGLMRYDFNGRKYERVCRLNIVAQKSLFKTVLPAKSCCLFQSCELQLEEDKKISKLNRLSFEHISLSDYNALTIDMCRYRINNGSFGDEKYILQTHDEIYNYAQISSRETEVEYSFVFNLNRSALGGRFLLCVEDESTDRISVNGKPVDKRIGWFIDKAIGKYDISDLVNAGKNEILLKYTIFPKAVSDNNEGNFETERNRFFYQKEPESVYILGDFDVEAKGKIDLHGDYYFIEKPEFEITAPSAKNGNSDLTSQRLWFYCGNARLATQYYYSGGIAKLCFKDLEATLAHIYVNGSYAANIISEPLSADITEFLKIGVNTIEVELIGNNRNLLGPHHHCKGKLNFVGVDSFKGKYSWTDFANPQFTSGDNIYTDAYSFIPFSVGDSYVEIFE